MRRAGARGSLAAVAAIEQRRIEPVIRELRRLPRSTASGIISRAPFSGGQYLRRAGLRWACKSDAATDRERRADRGYAQRAVIGAEQLYDLLLVCHRKMP